MPDLQRRVGLLDTETLARDFWDNAEQAQSKMRDLAAVRGELKLWTDLTNDVSSNVDFLALAVEDGDDELGVQLESDLEDLVFQLEEKLLSADVGIRTTEAILEGLRRKSQNNPKDGSNISNEEPFLDRQAMEAHRLLASCLVH